MLWGEIKVDFDDLKHIVHPNRRFDELYNTIMTCVRDLHVLSNRLENESKWFRTEVGNTTAYFKNILATCLILRLKPS